MSKDSGRTEAFEWLKNQITENYGLLCKVNNSSMVKIFDFIRLVVAWQTECDPEQLAAKFPEVFEIKEVTQPPRESFNTAQ